MEDKTPANAFQLMVSVFWNSRWRYQITFFVISAIVLFAIWLSLPTSTKEMLVAKIIFMVSEGQSSTFEPDHAAKNADLVVKALNIMEDGHCPHSMFYSNLQNACMQQAELMKSIFDRTGSAKNATFVESRNSEFGQVEIYRVDFENGVMNWWMNKGSDGRLATLFSPN